MSRAALLLSQLAAGLALGGCDNVGRAFDPGGGGGGGGPASNVFTAVAGAIPVDGRPKARDAFPKGSGWARSAPVVVLFSESMNQSQVVPAQGDALAFCRVMGTEQALPSAYDFLLGGTVLLIRPVPEWPGDGPNGPSQIEVVVSPEARDADGVRIGGSEPLVLATFTADADTDADPDGRVVATLPIDNARDQTREVPVYALFDRRAEQGSVTAARFSLEDDGGAITAGVSFPIVDSGQVDTRVARLDPQGVLPSAQEVRVLFADGITFPSGGTLDFRNRTPFARFRTVAAAGATAVALGNPVPGFDDKINRVNFDAATIDVTMPADALAGDVAVVRIYGLDANTAPAGDVAFVERSAAATADGASTVPVSFAGALGALDRPRFEDGSATFAVLVRRGSRGSGFAISADGAARIDVTAPTLTTAGPPAAADTGAGAFDLLTDQEAVAFHGVASERVSSADITTAMGNATSFGSGTNGGRFMLQPLFLGRLTAPLDYTLTMTDAAGNPGQPVTGRIVPRGVITGSVAATGMLTVEAYDDATLRPIAGALVLIEPGMPAKPAAGRMQLTTGSDGRAVFAALTGPRYSITVVAPGYDLTTLLDSGAGYASLPLRPVGAAASGTLRGMASFAATPGASVRAGCNVFDDEATEAVGAQLLGLFEAPIRPNRPVVVHGFSGTFDAVGNGAPAFFACGPCGVDGVTPTPAAAPAPPGETTAVQLAVSLPAGNAVLPSQVYTIDFAASAGLQALAATPRASIQASLVGLSGTTLFGTGTATMSGTATAFQVTAAYPIAGSLTLAALGPRLWVSAHAVDGAGNVARHRGLVVNNATGATLAAWPTPGIPAVAAPAGPSVGSPAVTYDDRLSAATVPGGLALTEMTATDGGGRRWRLLREDLDGAVGAVVWQLPDLAGLTGLGLGSWSVRVAEHLAFSVTMVPGDVCLEEFRRAQVTWARGAPVGFTVN